MLGFGSALAEVRAWISLGWSQGVFVGPLSVPSLCFWSSAQCVLIQLLLLALLHVALDHRFSSSKRFVAFVGKGWL